MVIPGVAFEIRLRRQDRRILDACLHVNVRGVHVIGRAVVKRFRESDRKRITWRSGHKLFPH